MHTKKHRNRNLVYVLVLSMLISLITPVSPARAVSKPALSKKTVYIKEKTKKTIKVGCSVKGSVKVCSLNPYFVSVSKKKSTLGKSSPASFVINGKHAGYAIIAVTVKLKKAIKKKKSFNLRLNVYVTEKSTPTVTPAVSPTVSPAATPTVTPTVTPTAAPTAKPTAAPTVMPTAAPTVAPTTRPTAAPTVSPTASPSSSTLSLDFSGVNKPANESVAYSRIIAMKSKIPDYTLWDNSVTYTWTGLVQNYGTRLTGGGCVAFACILSDAAFGYNAPATRVNAPSPDSIRIGDIIRINNDTHSAMVIGTDGNEFTLAEGNVRIMHNGSYVPVVIWNRKIAKSTAINYVWTRW